MGRFRLRLLISLLVVSALTLAGVAHVPMATARLAADAALAAAAPGQPSCHEMGEQHKAPVKALPMPDCCLMLCSSLPAVAQATAQPVEYAAADYVAAHPAPLAARVLSPDPGPPRA